MFNTLNIDKPATLLVKFSSPVDSGSSWIVSTKDGAYHSRVFDGEPSAAKISFPRVGRYYSNKEIAAIKILPLETFDIFDKVPEPERDYNPESVYIEKAENLTNTPARTWAKDGYIQTGEKFDKLNSQQKFFVLLHELAHQRFTTEWKTDLLALAHFLKLGYNESQAFYSLTNVLNRKPENIDRIKKMLNLLMDK